MSFKDLDINEMVSLTSPFVNDGPVKKTFLSIPEIAGFHPKVVAAHGAVVSVRRAEEITDPEVAELSAKQKVVDVRHDRLGRCGSLLVEARRERALAEDPPDEATAAACAEALGALFPDGAAILIASYRAEAGNTERLERYLDQPESADVRALLKSIPARKGETALDVVTQWIQAGTELGELETKKAARIAALQNEPAAPLRVVQAARSQWIKVASVLVQALELSDAPADAKTAILHPLVDAAARAGSRAARRAARTAAPDPAGAPGPAGTPPSDA